MVFWLAIDLRFSKNGFIISARYFKNIETEILRILILVHNSHDYNCINIYNANKKDVTNNYFQIGCRL